MTDMTPASPNPASKPKARPRPQVMKLTEAAAARVRELTARADSEIVGLRVGVKNGGCAGQSYTVEYAHEIRPTDEVVEDKGVKILVDPKAVFFLLDLFSDFGAVTIRPMFSGFGISVDGINFALALRVGLYFRADEQTIPQFEAEGSRPFQYQTSARTVTVGS